MDAPAHFVEGAWRLHEIPLDRFAGEAVVVDITERAKLDRDATMAVSDLVRCIFICSKNSSSVVIKSNISRHRRRRRVKEELCFPRSPCC